MALIEATLLSKSYPVGEGRVAALNGVSLSVEEGEFLAVVGPSGSGKSTLLNLIGCVEKPDSGSLRIAGIDVSASGLDDLAELRARRIGYIFQTFNLMPTLTTLENVEYPLWLAGVPAGERTRRAGRILAQVGLESFLSHKPRQLSGGQRQRVTIARALAGNPAVVLADEPTANLDQANGHEIISLMRRLNAELGSTFIFSTHDPKIMAHAGRIVQLTDGRLAAA